MRVALFKLGRAAMVFAFTPLLKAFLEKALEGEVEQRIADGDDPNRKNGKTKKIVRTTPGERTEDLGSALIL